MKKAAQSRSAHSSLMRERGLVPVSCPDCAGVLRLEEEGAHEYSLYVCQINHRYSTRSLIHAKEAQVERVLWSASVFLKQMLLVYQEALRKTKQWSPEERKSMRRRIHEVRKQSLAIRAMIEATHAVE